MSPDSEAKATVSGLQQELIKIGTDIRHISHELHPALLQELRPAGGAVFGSRGVQQGAWPHCDV